MKAQGWYPDPYRRHDDRWFSDGNPTRLVRDQDVESYDEPPLGQPHGQLPPGSVARDEPQPGQLPPYPRGAAGVQDWLARESRKHWSWWTVLLPALPMLALCVLVLMLSGVASAMACMDTCDPAAQARASMVATVDSIVLVSSGVLLVAGLAAPVLRRYIAPVLSASTVAAIGFAGFVVATAH